MECYAKAMIACPRHCGGSLMTDSTDPESTLLRCDLCARPAIVVLGEAVELKPQVGTKLDSGQPAHRPRISHANRHPNWQ